MIVLQYILSFIFIVQMYVVMVLAAIVYTPWAIFSLRGAYAAIHFYCNYVRWSAAWIVGLKSEVRGTVPTEEVLVASKHQSFFDILILVSVLPRPKFIMKKEILYMPIAGWYGKRIGCIPVNRGKGGGTIQKMLDEVENSPVRGGQLIIYPQGTRVAPGVPAKYKAGIGALYSGTNQTVVPAATNVGVFWPRHGLLRKRGTAVIEFLDPIPPGETTSDFMAKLEEAVETASDKLMAEGGFEVPNTKDAQT